MTQTQQNDNEVELIYIWYFIQRQRLFLAIVFISISAITVIYAITRPTIWQSRVSLVVGERLFFLQQAPPQQIESLDEIKYKYSQNTVITPIKNTRIIEISTTANSKDLAVEQVEMTMNAIIFNHKQIFENKKIEFVSLLNAISKENSNRTELVRLLDNASNSTLTKQLSDINTEKKPYSGMLLKILSIGSFIGLALAIFLATIKDYLERKTTPRACK